MEKPCPALSVISNCISLAQQIDNLVQRFKDSRSEVHECARTVDTSRKLLGQFCRMFETSCLPQEILQDYLSDIFPLELEGIQCLQSELKGIQYSVSLYLQLCSRKGFAGLAWRYKWGREIDKHQKNLAKLNGNLHDALVILNPKVRSLALEKTHAEKTHAKSPTKDEAATEQTLAISRQYFEAAQEIWCRESQTDPPITQIQRKYSIAAKEFQGKEWDKPCSPRLTFAVRGVHVL